MIAPRPTQPPAPAGDGPTAVPLLRVQRVDQATHHLSDTPFADAGRSRSTSPIHQTGDEKNRE